MSLFIFNKKDISKNYRFDFYVQHNLKIKNHLLLSAFLDMNISDPGTHHGIWKSCQPF